MRDITLKRWSGMLLLACTLAGVSVAHAQSWGYGKQDNQSQRGNDRRQSYDRYDDRQRYDQPRRDSRMSPDERRALRQQIDEAGRDIYRPRR